MRRLLCLCLCLMSAACADFPEIEEADRGAGPVGAAPPLLPFGQLEAATATGQAAQGDTGSLEARAAALRGRAAILRQPLRAEDDIDLLRARLAGLR